MPINRPHAVTLGNRETIVVVEDTIWSELNSIADDMELPLMTLVGKIDQARGNYNLSSAIRVFVIGQLPLHTLH